MLGLLVWGFRWVVRTELSFNQRSYLRGTNKVVFRQAINSMSGISNMTIAIAKFDIWVVHFLVGHPYDHV